MRPETSSKRISSPSGSAGSGRRYLALLFPFLSTDLHRRRHGLSKAADAPPRALFDRAANALRLAAVDEAAHAAGLRKGVPLAEARALVPALEVFPAAPDDDSADFNRILRGLFRWTPSVAAPALGEVFLDIAGCERLFGGEAAIARDVRARLEARGLATRGAVAATPGAAYACAAFAGTDAWAIIPDGGEAAAIRDLPVEALRLDAAAAERLRSLGLSTVGRLVERPRGGLSRRFDPIVLTRLDQALGRSREPLSPIEPPPAFTAALALPEPAETLEAALLAAAPLAGTIERRLERAGEGALSFRLSLFRADATGEVVGVSFAAPTRNAEAVLRLLRFKLEKGERPVDPGFGFEAFRLCAAQTAPLAPAQIDAFSAAAEDGADGLVERLVARLGPHKVYRLAPQPRHFPEEAETRARALGPAPVWREAETPGLRPLFLFDRPEPIAVVALAPDGPPAVFRWRKGLSRIVRAAGPERLLSDWRAGAEELRDYYRIEDEAGRRYWAFRRGPYGEGGEWFLHGLFA